MGFKRKLYEGQKFSQKLFDIMSKCATWKTHGVCGLDNGEKCFMLHRCDIVRAHDKAFAQELKKGQSTPYLPGAFPEQVKKSIFG